MRSQKDNYVNLVKGFTMKSKAQLKEELHNLIDGIEDEDILNTLNDDVVPYLIYDKAKGVDNEEEMSEEEASELNQAIKEADAGEVISLDEFLKEIGTWRTK
jgi:hypothetical protein